MSIKTFTEDFVTIENFCQKLNYSKHTIKPYISKGILPPLRKFGNQQVWDNTTDEFETYIKKINERNEQVSKNRKKGVAKARAVRLKQIKEYNEKKDAEKDTENKNSMFLSKRFA